MGTAPPSNRGTDRRCPADSRPPRRKPSWHRSVAACAKRPGRGGAAASAPVDLAVRAGEGRAGCGDWGMARLVICWLMVGEMPVWDWLLIKVKNHVVNDGRVMMLTMAVLIMVNRGRG